MKTFIKSSTVFVLIILLTGLSTISEAQVKLRYNFQQGKTFHYKTDMVNSITQRVMGQEMKILNNIHSITTVLVKSIADNGDMELVVSADSAVVHNSMQGKESTTPLANIIGKRTQIDVSNYGKILSRKMLDSLDAKSEMMGASIMQGAANLYMPLPEKEVKEGDSWNSSKIDTINSMGGNIIVTSNYTFTLLKDEQKNGKNCYKIAYKTALASNGFASMQGYEFAIDGTGNLNGTLYLEKDNCSLVSNEAKSENEMTLSSSGEEKMIIPITQNSTQTTDLIND